MAEARNLVKRYGSTVAVNDLSFSIRPGMVTGFLGPNGAGKTTTMRMILGLGAPTQGSDMNRRPLRPEAISADMPWPGRSRTGGPSSSPAQTL
jgi:ABC-2 type transport system ATP-binding protein